MPIAPPVRLSSVGLDLAPRVTRSATVVASPALAAETIIGTITLPTNLNANLGVILFGWAAFTVGASGSAVNLRIRKTDVSGSVVKATGLCTYTAADLGTLTVMGVDTSPTVPGGVYCLTMIVTAGAAESTVSAVELLALVV